MTWGAVAGAAIITVGGLVASNQQKKAAEGAANAQKEAVKEAGDITALQVEEQRRQFDLQMAEYQRKTAQLEDQYGQLQTMLAPYQQAGQGALYEMMALSGLAAPEGAKITTPASDLMVTGPARTTTPGRMGILSGAGRTGIVGLPENVDPLAVADELYKGGLSLSSDQWSKINPEAAASGNASARYYAAMMSQQLKQQHPDWTTQQIHDAIAGTTTQMAIERSTPSVSPAVNPYAGLTGEEAQAAAISKISDSPLLAELMRQGEQGILQNAAATGGLRGGNTQAVLSQYRPAMLKQAIDEQYSRLAGLSGAGMSATTAAGYTPESGGYPGVLGTDSTMAQLALQRGEINANEALAMAQANANMIGGISQGIGYGVGSYLNRPQTSTPTNQSGMQAVINPDGTVSYF